MKLERLVDIAEIKTGKYDANHSTDDGQYIFYTCAFGQFKSPTYSFEGDAIILPGNGANVGEVFFNDGEKFEVYQRTYVIQNIKAYSKYVYYFFKHSWKRSLTNSQYGSATNYIRMNNLTNFQIPIPSINDQIHIANILTKAENLIAQRKESIRLLDEYLKSTFLEMFGDPVRNDKGWKRISLSDFGTFKNGLNFTKNETGLNIRCLGVGDFKNLSKIKDISVLPFLSLSTVPSNDYLLRDEDIVFVRSNGNKELVGRCIVVYPKNELVTFSGFCIRFRIKDNKISPIYLSHLFRNTTFKSSMLQNGRGANIQNINQQILGELKIPYPHFEIQSQFAQIVEKTEALKAQYQQSLQELENLYGSLSQRAFRGQLTPKEYKLPDDYAQNSGLGMAAEP